MADETVQTGIIETSTEETENIEQVEETPEAELEAKPAESEEDKKFAAKFAALSRREKAVKQRERAADAKIAELEAKLKEMEGPKKEEKAPLEYRLKKDPFNTLKEIGMDFETLTRMALNDGKHTPELQSKLISEELEQKLEAKYGSMIKQLEEKLTKKEEQEKKEREEYQVQAYKNQISDFIKQNAEKFELIAAEDNGAEEIYKTILEDYNAKIEANGEVEEDEIMTFEDAANKIEERLLEQAKKRVNLSKIQKLLGASQKTETQSEPKQGKKVSPTLSNEQSQVQGAKKQFLSDEESRKEAAKLIRWVE